MKLVKVKSSNIERIGYIEKKKILVIQFNGNSKYGYKDVLKELYKEFLKSESKGSFFYQKIKDRFVCKKKADG